MAVTYMAIEKDTTVHDREKQQWLGRGILEIRVNSMTEGIEKAINNQFLFIVINADNINYMPELKILREATNDPILIATSSFTIDEQVEAMHNGADFYFSFSEPEKNMKMALAVVDRVTERAKQRKTPIKIITDGKILISPSSRQVFIYDTEVSLTKKEFELLKYLMINKGHFITHTQLLKRVWGEEYSDNGMEVLWQTVSRLRKKISAISSAREHIKIEREVGYKFMS